MLSSSDQKPILQRCRAANGTARAENRRIRPRHDGAPWAGGATLEAHAFRHANCTRQHNSDGQKPTRAAVSADGLSATIVNLSPPASVIIVLEPDATIWLCKLA